ncbi:MAG: type II secretion system ATPase GspE [Alphaproteobacteria bacterium]|nr:type II secretion system ATPase GspE [Alphaproteobacteria bacterium]
MEADSDNSDRRDFARFLVGTGRMTPEASNRAEEAARRSGDRFEVVVTRLGLVTERDLIDALASFLNLPVVAPQDFPASPVCEDALSARFARDRQFLPLENRPDGIAVALVHPLDTYTLDAIRFAVGKPVLPRLAYPADLEAALARIYSGDGVAGGQAGAVVGGAGLDEDLDRLKDLASEAPVIRLVNHLIAHAVELGASDIHIEPMEMELRIRFRIDGLLRKMESQPQQLAAAVVSRIKIMTKLNIAERRLPQDGRISLAVRGKDIDLRVSTAPTSHGESVVLRILDRNAVQLDFAGLGFEDETVSSIRALLAQAHGIMLVTGPTGSGKTTTLYAALTELNTWERKILTIEDPIEYRLEGINQVQVKPQIGLNFAGALRSFLRQDPDVMMVGEIRDLETAEIAVQAALTGHLILSTLHTNDAAGAVTRLRDMGVADYLLTSTLNGVVAQRLVRKLCPSCREPFVPLPDFMAKLGITSPQEGFFRARGCPACNHTGYQGRTSIVEVLAVNDAIREAILKGGDAPALARLAREAGMQPISLNGLGKASRGITSLEEVVRATRTG